VVVTRTVTFPTVDREGLVALPGGQGTINVPSWAPDGRQLAYVSYLGALGLSSFLFGGHARSSWCRAGVGLRRPAEEHEVMPVLVHRSRLDAGG
jgi:hypothetical protein